MCQREPRGHCRKKKRNCFLLEHVCKKANLIARVCMSSNLIHRTTVHQEKNDGIYASTCITFEYLERLFLMFYDEFSRDMNTDLK
jgi:hypothetical protein